jgi:SAM-dependent methyltransferase
MTETGSMNAKTSKQQDGDCENPASSTPAGHFPAVTYDRLAEYYDLVHAHVTDDIPLYLALANESGGPILELGCGSGRTLLPLLKAGFEAVGLDNSEAMLTRARERVRASGLENLIHLVHGEMTDFNLGKRFPLVTVPFNAWMHLPSRKAQLASLSCIKQHLIPGGQLVIDLPAPSTIVDAEHDGAMVLEGTFACEKKNESLLQFSSTRLDNKQQILHVTWIYDLVRANGETRRTVVPMPLHYLFPRQAELSLQETGLELKALWGDYDRSPYAADSEKLIILAEKPN